MKKALILLIAWFASQEAALAGCEAIRLLEGTSIRREVLEWSAVAGLLAVRSLYLDDAEPWAKTPLLHTEYRSFTGRTTVSRDVAWAAGALVGCSILLAPNKDGWLNATSYRHAKGFFEASAVCTPLVTGIAKLAVGKKRPDYPQRVAVTKDSSNARKSFWSGHAAVSFAIATYANLYLYEHLGCNAQKQLLWKIPVSVALFGAASYAAWSRVHDHVHDTLDVLVGAGAGTTISLVVYKLHDNRFGAFYTSKRAGGLNVRTCLGGLRVEYPF